MIDDRAIRELDTAGDVAAAIERVWGGEVAEAWTAGGPSVFHPTAVWRDDEGDENGGETFVTLKIADGTPPCDHDAFALGVARARADAIVTTGAVLRAEPALRHDPPGPRGMPQALAAWRRQRLGKRGGPRSLVLTSGRDLDLEHPLLASGRAIVFTGEEAAARLRAEAAERGVAVEVAGVDEPGIRAAVAWLREDGCAAISIEAGPSTSGALYRAPVSVDELLLSVYEAHHLDPSLRAGPLPPPATLARALPRAGRPYRVATRHGSWTLIRRSRA